MINLSYDDIVKTIKQNTDISEDEIKAKVEQKLQQLSGLISKEGAAHIVANELNVQIVQPTVQGGDQEVRFVKLKELMPNMRNVSVLGKVLQKYDIREFNSAKGPGKVGSILIGDESGFSRVVFWNDLVDKMSTFEKEDTIKVVNGYVRDNQGRKEVHINSMSEIIVNPDGELIDNVKENVVDRKKIKELTIEDQSVEVLGTVVQAYDLRFFEVCPDCNKRVRNLTGEFECPTHGSVSPAYSYVFNFILDDSTSTIRTVCFKKQFENLIGKENTEIVQMKDDAEALEQMKHDLLGKIVKIRGRVTNNELFNRLEMVANVVFANPDPNAELQKMNSKPEVTPEVKPAPAAATPDKPKETLSESSSMAELESLEEGLDVDEEFFDD